MNDPYAPIWATYYAPRLSSRELRQFTDASAKPQRTFLDTIIRPSAYRPDLGTYMSVSPTKNLEGRDHSIVRDLADADWQYQSLFTNVLTIATVNDPNYNHPMLRTALGPHYIFTVEFDSDLTFFRQQLGWLRTPNNPLDSPIGQFVAHLRATYADFVGLNVTYSGNKSLHYHFAFSTHIVAQRAPERPSLRYGLQKAWDALAQEFQGFAALALPASESPDRTLRQPEWYRRLPLGTRLIDKAHAFDVPKGEPVPQLVLWEHVRSQSGRGAKGSIFNPADFTRTDIPATARKGKAAPLDFLPGTPEADHCADRLREFYPDYPSFAGFVVERGELRAQFYNGPGDKRPSSYMAEGFASIMIQGSFLGPKPPRLPKCLGDMLAIWSDEYRERHLAPGGRQRTDLEQRFAEAATDRDAAIAAMGTVLDSLVMDDRPCHFLSAPEGISKSRTLIANTPSYLKRFENAGEHGLMMFAFSTYKLAQEKADEFNAAHPFPRFGKRFKAVVLKSWSRNYSEACEALGVAEITLARALELGSPSILQAVRVHQPEVMERVASMFRGLRWSYAGAVPILFTVHDVAHEWVKDSASRLMLSPAFWDKTLDPKAQRQRARDETALAVLIHDEVSKDNLVRIDTAEACAWVEDLSAMPHPEGGRKKLWPKGAPLTRLLEGYTLFAKLNPAPEGLTFEEAVAIRDVPANGWDRVTAKDSGEYGAYVAANNTDWRDIYGDAAGRDWRVHVKAWPTTSAAKVLILTTEAVPTAIIRKIGKPWTVTELDTPQIAPDVTDVRPSRDVISRNLHTLVREARAEHLNETGRPLWGIGNKMSDLVQTQTHHTAKGSNGYIGRDIVQTMALLPPEEYARLEALNAWCGRDELIRLYHLDQFNQTAGRNLGFRAPRSGPKPAHIVLINRRLFEALTPLLKFARYEMRERVSQRVQKAGKTGAKAAVAVRPMMSGKERLAALRQALAA
ncbi:hypothetical protein [Brevundimonas sp. C43]|uniref:hypothetical protein n=1 Tax=Brevundimonas sp. C43 TaxID=3068314 RepID=UPI00273F075A|nr:hypothetical protein [Brevundimonas sp. C43]